MLHVCLVAALLLGASGAAHAQSAAVPPAASGSTTSSSSRPGEPARPESDDPTRRTRYEPQPARLVEGRQAVEEGGVRISLVVGSQAKGEAAPKLVAGSPVRLGLEVIDAASGTAIRGVRPAGWLQQRSGETADPNGRECLTMIQTALSGGLTSPVDVDLNQFFIFSLNADRTISVINPLISFSRTKLMALIELPGDARDWLHLPGPGELLVTIPAKGVLAKVDARERRAAGEIAVGGRPGQIVAGSTESLAWVADDASGELVGVDSSTRSVVARIPIGQGPLTLAAAGGGSRIVVGTADGRLAVVHAGERRVLGSLEAGEAPSSLAISELSGAAYATLPTSGALLVVDLESGAQRARQTPGQGVSVVSVTPDGRWGLAINTTAGQVAAFDTATGAVVTTFEVPGRPDRVVYTSTMAYFRSLDRPEVALLPWPELGRSPQMSLVPIAIGQKAPGDAARVVAADSVAAVPAGGAIVAGSRSDKTLYYYMEGMMAPMGSYQNYSREPLAVKVLDFSLRETAPGLYATSVTFPRSGVFDVPFMVDSPRIAGCFRLDVAPSPDVVEAAPISLRAEYSGDTEPKAGTPARLAYTLIDSASGLPATGLKDVFVLAFQPPGLFQTRLPMLEQAPGTYSVELTFPDPGLHLLHIASASRGISYGALPATRITVGEPKGATAPDRKSRGK